MDCRITQARLQDFLEGSLSAAERLEIAWHLEGCAECAALAAFMSTEPPVDEAPDLAAVVLERTSGSACDRAHEILCDAVDGELDDVDSELLTLHLESCDGCAELSVALERLREDLPAMAEIEPAAGFTEQVLAATLPRRRDRWAGLAARWARGWASLLARPRIAWEAGYVGAVAVWLVISVLGPPFEAASLRPAVASPVKVIDSLTTRATTLGQHTWDATGGRSREAWRDLQTDLSLRYQRTEVAIDALRQNGEKLKTAALELDLEASGEALKAMRDEARSAWERFADVPDDTNENTN
jgi:predicted anti-sigma-YlaC factor YlaD